MQDRLARHFAPAEATVLGQRLRPYTLWHWRTLAMFDSPFVCDTGEETFADLLFAVRVCRQPANSPLDFIEPKLWERALFALLRWRFAGRLLDEADTLLEYIHHYTGGPIPLQSLSEGAVKSRSIKSHPTMYLTGGLHDAGYTEEQAWAFTPGMARWRLASVAEFRGAELNIVSERMIRDAIEAGYTPEEMGIA